MENFTLKSFKLKGFDAEVRYTQIVDDCEAEYKATIAKGIQRELQEQLDAIKRAAAEMLGFIVDVRGVVLSGKDENSKMGIYCQYETPCGYISFRTPKIAYLATDSVAAAIITDAVPKLEKAVYDFLFNGAGEELEVC